MVWWPMDRPRRLRLLQRLIGFWRRPRTPMKASISLGPRRTVSRRTTQSPSAPGVSIDHGGSTRMPPREVPQSRFAGSWTSRAVPRTHVPCSTSSGRSRSCVPSRLAGLDDGTPAAANSHRRIRPTDAYWGRLSRRHDDARRVGPCLSRPGERPGTRSPAACGAGTPPLSRRSPD